MQASSLRYHQFDTARVITMRSRLSAAILCPLFAILAFAAAAAPAAQPEPFTLNSSTHRPVNSALDLSTTTVTFATDQIPQAKVTGLPTSLAGKQPLDADLTAVAALATNSFGLQLLTKANAAAIRSYIGGTTLASWDIADGQPLDSDLTAIAALSTDSFGRALLTKASAGAVRTYIGGTTLASWDIADGQPLDTDLTAIAALSTTSYGRAMLALADGSAAITAFGKTTLSGYNITDAQPLDTDLTAIAALSTTSYGRALLALADGSAAITAFGKTTLAGYGITDPIALTNVANTFTGANIFTPLQSFNSIASSSITTSQLANAGAPSVSNVGVPGATTWTYKIVAKLSDGTPSAAGSTGSTTTGNATIDSSNKNSLTWTAVTGAASYDVYRTVAGLVPSSLGKIANVSTNAYIDAGAAGDASTAPSTNATGGVVAYSFTGNGAAINLTASGAGGVSRTLADHLNETVNVKDYGAVGDGATNDTAAINAARLVSNAAAKTLLFPPGTYLVTQGALGDFNCSVEGPDANIQAAPGGSGALISTDYNEAAGRAFRTFRLNQISGVPFTYTGTGLYLKHGDYSHFYITDLRWFSKGIHLDGYTNTSHVASNDLHIGNLFVCDDGIVMSSGDGGYWCEINRIFVNYSQGHRHSAITIGRNDGLSAPAPFTANASTDLLATTAHGLTAGTAVTFASTGTLPGGLSAGPLYYVIASGLTADVFKVSATVGGSAVDITSTGSGVHSWSRHFTAVHNNFIEFMALEVNQVEDSNGIVCLGDCQENDIFVRSNFGGAFGTNGKDLITSGTNNHYQLASVNWSRITVTGSEIIETAAFAKDGSARSETRGSTAPTVAYHRIGDIQWNNASAYPAGWYCTVAGTPGTWQPILVETAAPPVASIPVSTFAGSWVNFGAGRRDASYWKDAMGMVHVVAFLKSGSVTDGTTMFTLPAGYRPGATEIFDGIANNLHCTIQVDTAGNVQVFSAAGNTSLGIPNIQFRTD
jgi:hypothetical protein